MYFILDTKILNVLFADLNVLFALLQYKDVQYVDYQLFYYV